MIKILFICHGNICRSPMAEFLFKDMVSKAGVADDFEIASAATSTEEMGNEVHRGTKGILYSLGISTKGKTARQMTKKDYVYYDYLIAMDNWNLRNIARIIGNDSDNKVSLLLDHSSRKGQDIADPWYTGNFDITYNDIMEGLKGLLLELKGIAY